MTFLVFSLLFGGTAAIMTVFIGPGAAGGGTAELMGYLNGINYPGLISFRTLFVKIFGLGLAVSSGLCIGKEGPLAHIGAILGHVVAYIPLPFLEYFRNDVDRRELAAAGAAAGVAAAFGSPIGGSLFAYEISRPSTFWSFGLTWKIFFCSSISTFVLNILSSVRMGKDVVFVNAGLIKFGQYDENPYKLHDFPFFILLGVLGGLLGALFIYLNGLVNGYRRQYLRTKWQRVLEVVVLVAATSTFIYYAPMILYDDCLPEEDKQIEASFIKYKCKPNEYNPLATLLLNSEGTVIKALLNKTAVFNY
jgi:H+/Cl- antiporter ClcA